MSSQGRAASPSWPFSRVLIANRGEIAVRLIRACRELGLESVAVYSDADAGAPHVRAADQAVRLGPAPAAESYLRADRIVAAALATGAQAIHPGYGFLAERAAFAEACLAAGLVFVGPAPATLAGLGDKLAARRAARDAGVPVVPGTLEPARFDRPASRAHMAAVADDVGWPLLVKAAAGGGGRGMRRVEHRAELQAALASAAHEAEAAFGDGSLYLERFVQDGRHIEVQLLGDAQGNVVALGERDCSAQRRHQKLLEEAPAPGLSPAERKHLGELAVRVARAVGLQGAATCEFLRGPDGAVWFLEVNVRLQVEHGVTELVTGLDLVHEQFRIAAGEPLSRRVLAAAARVASPDRHAIEVRFVGGGSGRRLRAPARPPDPLARARRPGCAGRWLGGGGDRDLGGLRPAPGQGAGGRGGPAGGPGTSGPGPRRDGGRRAPDDAAVPPLARPRAGLPGRAASAPSSWPTPGTAPSSGRRPRRWPSSPRWRPTGRSRRRTAAGATPAPGAPVPPAVSDWAAAGRREALESWPR